MRLIGSMICLGVMMCGLGCAKQATRFTIANSNVGTKVDLTGKWIFTPTGAEKSVAVPVPQMLSRIQWWLDDSEDFKKWEQQRLDALGIDLDKTDEGTYSLTFDVPSDWPADRHLW